MMRLNAKFIAWLLLLAATAISNADTILRQRTLADLSKASTSVFHRYDTDVTGISYDAGLPVASLRFNHLYSSFGQRLTSAQDWSPYNLVCMNVRNYEPRVVRFKFIVLLTSDPNNYANAMTASFQLNAGETKRFIFHLNLDDPMPYGMEYIRPVLTAPFARVISGNKFRDLRTIYHWRVSHQENSPSRVSISDLRLIRQSMYFTGMVDAWGQYTDRSWSDKIRATSDFAARNAEELTRLDANPPLADRFGTTKLVNETPQVGKWAVVKRSSGRKYFQHPNGRLFWCLGLNAVHEGSPTPVQGRETYFQSLPSTAGTYAGCYETLPTLDGSLRSFSFHRKNLIQKYGVNYKATWLDRVRKRLASWGVNTLGIQADELLVDGTIPYTTIIYTDGFSYGISTPESLWGRIPDPYASTYYSWILARFTAELAPHVNRTNFMGVFVDNELAWGGTSSDTSYFNLARGVLNSASNQPAKIAFRDRLIAKYGSIGALNSAWGRSFSSWDSFLSTRWLPTSYTTAMKTDFKSFILDFANKYYYAVRTALKNAGLKSLYLGSRFWQFNPEVIDAADNYCDVLSFNFYRTVDRIDWTYLDSLKKPVIFSEFGYGVQDRGTFGGPAEASSHVERAGRLRDFLNRALSTNNIIGAQWYGYGDQPITGRWSDYENTALGMVDVTDTPYWDSVHVLRAFASNMYLTRG